MSQLQNLIGELAPNGWSATVEREAELIRSGVKPVRGSMLEVKGLSPQHTEQIKRISAVSEVNNRETNLSWRKTELAKITGTRNIEGVRQQRAEQHGAEVSEEFSSLALEQARKAGLEELANLTEEAIKRFS